MGTLSVEMSSLGRTGEGERTLQYQDKNLQSKTQKIEYQSYQKPLSM